MDEILNLTNSSFNELFSRVALISTIVQALGGVILIYIIFSIISLVMNRKKNKLLEEIHKNVKQINGTLKKKK